MTRRLLIFLSTVFFLAAGAKADNYPAGITAYRGQFSLCEDAGFARKLVEVRKYGLTVAEDQLALLAKILGKSGKPICRPEWVDLSSFSLEESINLGVIYPIDLPPVCAWIVGVKSGSVKYWILWFLPLEAA